MAIKTYIYKKVDSEQQLAADAHYGTSNFAGTTPIALVMHGGGFTAGQKEDVPTCQIGTLVELGFVVVSVNYRLCPTISIKDGPIADCMDCLNWCRSDLPGLLEKDVGISVDPRRLVTLGHSAGGTLALLMAANPDPPLAILDLYGAKYFSDQFWHNPNPDLAFFDFPEEFSSKIWMDMPPPSSFSINQSELASHQSTIDFSRPRNAWLFSSMAKGTLMRDTSGDGDYPGVDPTTLFSSKFPPVFSIHGTMDKLVPVRFAKQAYKTLQSMGVEVELRLVEGQDHAFDENLSIVDKQFGIVREGLEFLARHAEAYM